MLERKTTEGCAKCVDKPDSNNRGPTKFRTSGWPNTENYTCPPRLLNVNGEKGKGIQRS